MKDPEKTNNFFLKLSGKASIPEELEIGENYEARIAGTITTKTEADNEDGSHSLYYKFEPVLVEVIDSKGKSIKAKDTRRASQLLRAAIWRHWSKHPELGMESDDYYEKVMLNLIQSVEEICEMYGE